MAPVDDNPSSPRSSVGAEDSLKATPETRITTISPEATKPTCARLLHALPRSGSDHSSPVASKADYPFGSGDGDPFMTPRNPHRTRLSPTALAFNPFIATGIRVTSEQSAPVATTLSTDLGLSRYLQVSSDSPLAVEEVKSWLNSLDIPGRRLHGLRSIDGVDGKIYIHFHDIRDSCSVLTSILTYNQRWKVEYCGPVHGDELRQSSILDSLILSTGQVHVVANGTSVLNIDVAHVSGIIRNILSSFGRLFAFITVATSPKSSFTAVAEFCDICHALNAVENYAQVTTTEGLCLMISPYQPRNELFPKSIQTSGHMILQDTLEHQRRYVRTDARCVTTAEERANQTLTMYPLMYQSPFVANVPYILDSLAPGCNQSSLSPINTLHQSYPILSPLYHAPPSPALTVRNGFSPSRTVTSYFRSDGRRQNATRVTRSSYNCSANHHNYVDINRIRDGIDVRTTIMLRNIPNKVDQAMLKRIIDESSWGKYDFMYLRIDFANDCNVGYAFINFVDPLDIIDFVETRGNQRWNCFKSDKIAEISYATIQGKDCLVQKFRNSSVMLEAPHYRPKLYFTCNGPRPELAGQEETFPDPDNQSKMKRSCENAEHVGLFTPNAGQHYRDEQRRRRSQYDRGTRLAALEEYDYEAAFQNLYNQAA